MAKRTEQNKRTKKSGRGWLFLLTGLFLVLLFLIGFNMFRNSRAKTKYFYTGSSTAPPALTPVEYESNANNVMGVVLEETAPAEPEYFNDAIFVGDSLTDGFRLFDFLSSYNSIGYVGINTYSAQYQTFYQVPDGRTLTMVEAITYYQPRKIYIMLGSNGINFESPEWLIGHYKTFAQMVQSQNPDAYVILQSIPPSTADKAAKDSHYLVENVDYYNNLIRNLALEDGYFFLDTNSALRDENGYMIESYAAGDGIHMNRTGYYAWYEYILTHTIQGDSAYSINTDGLLIAIGREQDEEANSNEQPEPGSENGEGDPPQQEETPQAE